MHTAVLDLLYSSFRCASLD